LEAAWPPNRFAKQRLTNGIVDLCALYEQDHSRLSKM